MKNFLFLTAACMIRLLSWSQGSTCSTAIPLTLNGSVANFSTSATLGSALVCTNYTGSYPITWFRFTTNSAGDCPLLNITASDNAACEIVLYTGCTGGQSMQSVSSMCFDDGTGLWAPAETFVVQPNHTYYLRIRTSSACTLSISGQHYIPTNTTCVGATSINTGTISDNNACHKPATEITPGGACAFTLENTAFYQFYIASSGSAIINVTNVVCDNQTGNNTSGFQVGFFTGDCNNLLPINCTNGSGVFFQATTVPQPAGTHMYVAIDGMNGSNCKYQVTGINVYGVLSGDQLKKFSVWKKQTSNSITWEASTDPNTKFIVERSADGNQFKKIGELQEIANTVLKEFRFEDETPLNRCYYRIRRINPGGKVALSHVIFSERELITELGLGTINAQGSQLTASIETEQAQFIQYTIFSNSGQELYSGKQFCTKGRNQVKHNIASIPAGNYIMRIAGPKSAQSKKFVKY